MRKLNTTRLKDSLFDAPFNYISAQPTETQPTSVIQKPVMNGRESDLPGWQECGFELMNLPSTVTDWGNEKSIVERHYDEIRQLAKRLTGCDFALVGSHIIRGAEQAKLHQDLGPIAFVHSDFADSYGDRMRELYTDDTDESKISLKSSGATVDDVRDCSRLMIIQFWRNLGEAKMDLPLAFCDARTVAQSDLRPFAVQDYAGGGFDFETLGIAHEEGHAWYTYPNMTQDEVAVFRTYDSALIGTGNPYWTPHSAFPDPEVEPGKPGRVSIELRATCLFK